MSEHKIGQITIGRHTRGHMEWLKSKGYEVVQATVDKRKRVKTGDNSFTYETKKADVLQIKVTKFIDGTNISPFVLGKDDQEAIETLKGVVSRKEALTYQTVVQFPDGTKLFGTPACTKLGPASALVMSPVQVKEEKPEKPKVGFDF